MSTYSDIAIFPRAMSSMNQIVFGAMARGSAGGEGGGPYTANLSSARWQEITASRNLAGVVVNNAPAFREALPYQAEDSADITLLAFQMPVTEDQCGISA
jgi:hypothetical protein